jgi:hypothetical protein
MKTGSYVLAVVAFGSLSINIAVAAHHGHRTGTIASQSKTDTPSLTKSPAPTDQPQGSLAPPPDTVGKQGDAGAPIDISITVNQGRLPSKGKGRSLTTKRTVTAAPGLALKQPGHDLHQPAPAAGIGAVAHPMPSGRSSNMTGRSPMEVQAWKFPER